MMRPLATFSFFNFFNNFFIFSLSSSFLPPHPSFLLVPPSSSSLFPPCPSFLLIPLFLVHYCLNHLESVKVHFSSILTDRRTKRPTDKPTDKACCRDADASKNRKFLKDIVNLTTLFLHTCIAISFPFVPPYICPFLDLFVCLSMAKTIQTPFQ